MCAAPPASGKILNPKFKCHGLTYLKLLQCACVCVCVFGLDRWAVGSKASVKDQNFISLPEPLICTANVVKELGISSHCYVTV